MENEQLLKIIIERFDKVDQQINEVLQRLEVIEQGQQEDIKGALTLINKKVDSITYDIDYLSEKTGKHDTKINSIEKRIQS
ncbi:hypothetical protein [Alkalihalobacillus sp. TS-13]|uniref:hypothetical protein n=1 Tax=Alkalihalobacillus sp. TS-13 TaxID=2842455 RepID=UPI001C887D72|nr:hypothetical protein [Alkalihalobacillus sp. TS-13]